MTPRTAPGAPSPLNQFDLRRAVNRDHSLSACDRACVGEIIDWHHNDYGNAWICYDILKDRTGFSERQVIRSVGRLLEKGYISLFRKGGRGVGAKGRDGDKLRGGNRYQLNLSLGCKKKKANNLAAECSDIGVTANPTKCSDIHDRANQNTLTSASDQNQNTLTPVSDTHTYMDGPTRDRPTVSMYLTEEGTRGSASPTPPRAPGGAGGSPPRDPVAESFKELWTAYAFKHERPKAKAAYAKLNPDVALHAQMVAAASAWASAYNDNGTEPQYRKKLHNWLDGENWDADPPLPYVDRKAAAIANKRRNGPKTKAPAADTRKSYTARGGKAKAPLAAGSRNPTTAPGKSKRKSPATPVAVGLRPTKPGKALSSSQKWLGQQVASGALSVAIIAQLLVVKEQDVQSILDGRATVGGSKWNQLQKYAARHAPRATAGGGGVSRGAGHPDQASNGAASSRSVDSTVPTTKPAWTDDRAWAARIDAARGVGNHRVVLRQWAEAAGGGGGGGAIYIPDNLPHGYARSALQDYARVFGLEFRMGKPAASKATPPTPAAPAPRPSTTEPQSAALTSPTPPAEPPTLPKASPPTPAPPAGARTPPAGPFTPVTAGPFTPAPTAPAPPTPLSWLNANAWSALIDAAEGDHRLRDATVDKWVVMAGGRTVDECVYLPPASRCEAMDRLCDAAKYSGFTVFIDEPAATNEDDRRMAETMARIEAGWQPGMPTTPEPTHE